MKVLVATRDGQGLKRGDFCNAEPGELVRFGSECDGEAIDGKCGCRRSLVGVKTARGTTTMAVVDQPIDMASYTKAIAAGLRSAGWAALGGDTLRWAEQDASELARIAAAFPVGAVVQRRGNSLSRRVVYYGTCPTCGAQVPVRMRKDRESFTMLEVLIHMLEHGPVGRAAQDIPHIPLEWR
jgi:hypothetical protein